MKIIVKKKYGYDRRPRLAMYHKLTPSDKPITVLREVGEAAIAAGAATEYKGESKSTEKQSDGARTD